MADRGAAGLEVLLDPLALAQRPALWVLRDDHAGAAVVVLVARGVVFGVERDPVDAAGLLGREAAGGERLHLSKGGRRELGHLHATGGNRLEGGRTRRVALHQRVVVAEHAVPRDAEAGRLERPVHVLEEAGEVADRARPLRLAFVLGLVGRVTRPVLVVLSGRRVGAVRLVVLVAAAYAVVEVVCRDPAGARHARVRVHADAAVHQVDEPARLVPLGVVRTVAGRDRELDLAPGDRRRRVADLRDHLVQNMRRDSLVRPIGGGERVSDGVEELHTGGRLLVDHVCVCQLAKEEELGPPLLAIRQRLPQVVADDIGLAGHRIEPVVAVPVRDRLLERGARTAQRRHGRHCGAQRGDGDGG